MSLRIATLAAFGLCALAAPAAFAQDAWSDLRPALYEDRDLNAGGDLVALTAPYRSMDDARAPLGVSVEAPAGELIRKVSLIIDNNPMPVSAVFDLAEPLDKFSFASTMRMNGPSPVRVVMETSSGALYMSEVYVKTSALGACGAPPNTDPAVALKTLGRMSLEMVDAGTPVMAQVAALTAAPEQSMRAAAPQARLSIMHPSHSGMQMDQISLLYLPARYVDTIAVEADDRPLFTMTGSISLSENPELTFDVPADASSLTVRMTDTENASFEKTFSLFSG